MSIPSQTDSFKIVLDNIEPNREFTRTEICEVIASLFNLTDEEKQERTNSGIQVYKSRINWAVSYLSRAGFLSKVSRGNYILSDLGKNMQNQDISTSEFFRKIKSIIYTNNPWKIDSDNVEIESENESSTISPQEQIDNLLDEIDDSLSSELLQNILNMEPAQFENLVVELIEKMGYGKGSVTQLSRDNGIDGIITTDSFGFDPILTQAKLYKPENKISRPDIQKFAGAMNNCSKGVFVTTSVFTSDAIEFAKTYTHADIKLIDGNELTDLMIKHGLGVTTIKSFEIKRLDTDYFEN